jgi:hypothetical protein
MAIITLGGVEYITEAIEDESIPAHDYDSVINVSEAQDPDEWFGRVQSEWPNLPDEIKHKVIDSTGAYVGQLNSQVNAPAPAAPPAPGTTPSLESDPNDVQNDPNATVTEAPLDEAVKDSAGNEVYDFTEGKQHAKALDNAALEHVRKDLIDVIKIQEKSHSAGHNTPKLGYYWDEYWTVIDEIARRMKAGQQFNLEPWSLDGGRQVDDKIQELGE